ncbi:L-Cystine ABC transporter, ATP-binding protein TcyC [Paenibacillus sp. JCM 10914]|nr:L-Cystine ABC transporter, ATP-binding protein TcyC [Paenibacillus sp. JCM 10914]
MIQLTNISKSYGKNTVLKSIDLTVNKGEVVVILGPSGSGKTTLLRCVNYLEKPNGGEIIIGDYGSIASAPRRRRFMSSVRDRRWCFSSTICSNIRRRSRM